MPVPASIQEISQRAEALRDHLIHWANQNSGSNNFAGLAKMHDLLATDFAAVGEVTSIALPDTRARALRIRFSPEAPRQILFSGHYDTVYGGDHPFQRCQVLDNKLLRGPGVADMKGGLLVMLTALQSFARTPHAERIGGEIILTPDEEIGSVGSRALLEEAAPRHAFALVFEPARENGNLVRARMGTGIFTARCRGRSAHAGRAPETGRNAILALAEYLPRADALAKNIPDILLNVGLISGGAAPNIVPDLAEAQINIRVARANDGETVLQQLREAAAPINAREGFSLEIIGQFNRPPKEITAFDESLFGAWQQSAGAFGEKLCWQDVGGGSDGNLLAAVGLPTLDGLGPVGGELHSPNEYVRLTSLVSRAQVAAYFLHRLAAGEIQLPTS
ncbi:MAG TPA: hydrolase [Opitutaceae bacterium]|nr:hydrolase [Opitutaceae bacterium]